MQLLVVTVQQVFCVHLLAKSVSNVRRCNFTQRSLLCSSLAKLCVDTVARCPLLVLLSGKPDFELRGRLGENLNLDEQFLQRETPGGSGLTDLLLRKSRCLFSFSSILMRSISFSLVGLRHDVTLLRPRSCSCLSALISTFWSKENFPGDSCGPMAVAAASMARL